MKLTKYEQQIGLDKALSRRERKSLLRKQYGKQRSKEHSASDVNFQEARSNDVDNKNNTSGLVEEIEIVTHQTDSDVELLDAQNSQSESRQEDRNNFPVELDDKSRIFSVDERDNASTLEEDAIKLKTDEGGLKLSVTQYRHSNLPVSSSEGIDLQMVGNEVDIEAMENGKQTTEVRYSSWNFDKIIFPDFGIDTSTIVLEQPHKNQTPDNFETNCTKYQFERVSSINQKKEKKKSKKEETDIDKNLKFSNPFMGLGYNKGIKSCKNWQEYKLEMNRRRTERKRRSEFPHLYADVEPLVKPEGAISTGMYV